MTLSCYKLSSQLSSPSQTDSVLNHAELLCHIVFGWQRGKITTTTATTTAAAAAAAAATTTTTTTTILRHFVWDHPSELVPEG